MWCVSVDIWLSVSDLCPLIITSLSCHPLRWAQFFICPLMIRDAIDREVEAVDSGESWCLCAPLLCAEKLNFSCLTWSSTFHQPHCWVLLTQLFCTPLITVFFCLLEFFCLSFCLSEYQLAKPSDSHRKEMLFGSLAKPGHPMGKFCWGELVNTTAGTHNTRRASLGYVQQ